MTIATQYAKALHQLVEREPTKGKTFLKNLHTVLERRGHEKLARQIVQEYERLETATERVAAAKTVTPERERTRVLFELYKKLVANG